ncbi:MAG: TonB-dependent receptor plug domain-containing protein, partial [Pseudomonadales bacterium]
MKDLRRYLNTMGSCLLLGAAAAVSADTVAPPAGRPLDVFDRAALASTGHTDLPRALAALLPAYRFAAPFAVNGDDHARAGSLRGLAPDQMVVLVNGKRQHASARFYTSDQAGRGSVGFDLALLPLAAVARVEVLSGGAGGRHGSGAQAGVINIVLDDAAAGGRIEASFG